MGFYMEVPEHNDKAEQLVRLHKGERRAFPPAWKDIPEDKFLVVVVDNVAFEAAGIAVDEREYNDFLRPDGRDRDYVLVPKEEVYKQHYLKERE
jgi:hypothetical protein